MAGIYVHIPFCKQACYYCNFHFSTKHLGIGRMVDAIVKEVKLNKNYLKGETIDTIYFGGGTPSLLNTEQIDAIITAIRKNFTVNDKAEITLEANPDDISEEKLLSWKENGFNRISLGVQSFFDEDLKWMNRVHNSEQAHEAIKLVMQHFTNVTIDLIYGFPTLTNEKWEQNLKTVLSYKVPHLSCYALTVEPRTVLHVQIEKQQKEGVDEEKQAAQFEILTKTLSKAGFEHYEISNFAKPGFRSKHNSSYWQGEKYLGLGPSAHSYNGKSRQWNFANNSVYQANLNNNMLAFEKEELTTTQQLNEYVMLSLRTMEGINLKQVEKTFGKQAMQQLLQRTAKHEKQKTVAVENNFILLTKKAKFLADGIAADLFEEENQLA